MSWTLKRKQVRHEGRQDFRSCFPCSLPHSDTAFTRSGFSDSSLILVFTLCFYVSFLPFFLKIPAADDRGKISLIRLFFLLGFTEQEMENKENLQLRY